MLPDDRQDAEARLILQRLESFDEALAEMKKLDAEVTEMFEGPPGLDPMLDPANHRPGTISPAEYFGDES
jgi:hypothetical protein